MILADSGFWVALVSADDKHHDQAQRAAQQHASESLVTTWPVLAEASHLIGRASVDLQIQFVRNVRAGACEVHDLQLAALGRMASLMHKYRDQPMDFADASLVVLAEALGEGRILSTDDRDFTTYRWKNTKPFQNLLLNG